MDVNKFKQSMLNNALEGNLFPNIKTVDLQLKDICKLVNGDKLEGKSYTYMDVKYLRGNHNSKIINSGRFVSKDEIIILVDGENSGEAFVVPHDGYLGSTFRKIKLLTDIDNKFFMYILQKVFIYLKTNKRGSAIPHLDKKIFDEIKVKVPSIEDQRRIVDVLELVDEFVAKGNSLEELRSNFQTLSEKSILQYAIEGKLVPQNPNDTPASILIYSIKKEKEQLIKDKVIKKIKPLELIKDDEIPFDIPSSWEWVRWGEISNSIQYGANAGALESGNAKLVRISDIQNDEIQWNTVPNTIVSENDLNTYLLNENDILFARTGGTVGKSVIVKNIPKDGIFIYAGYLIRTNYNRNIYYKYLKCFLNTPLYWEQLKSGTIGSAQPNCNGQTLSQMIIPLPPLEEQKRIVAKIEELLDIIKKI